MNSVQLGSQVNFFNLISFRICLGKGCYWVSYILFVIALLSGISTILIISYGIYYAIGGPFSIFVNAFVQMYVWINQTRLSILTYDVEESVLTIVSRRSTLFCFLCCCCGKEKRNICRVFVHPICCSQTLCIVLANGAVLLPKAVYSEDTLNEFAAFLNQKLFSNNPTQYQLGLQFYLMHRNRKNRNDCRCGRRRQTPSPFNDVSSMNAQPNAVDEQPDAPVPFPQKPIYASSTYAGDLPTDFV